MINIIFWVVLFILFISLQKRIKKVEEALKIGSTQPMAPRPAQTMPNAAPVTPAPAMASGPSQMTAQQIFIQPKGPDWTESFSKWAKEDWLLKLGALLLLIAFGWFVQYAFLHGWIGPMGRITLGIGAGIAIMLIGWWRIKQYVHQGSIFLVLGSSIILITVLAARHVYGFFTPLSGLSIMFLSVAFIALMSVRHKIRSLALVSLILAGIAPLLTNGFASDYPSLFAYLIVVTIGAIWIIALTGWEILTPAALVLISFYSLPHLSSDVTADKGILLLYAYAFAALFFITSTISLIKGKYEDAMPSIVAAAGNGLFLLAWIMTSAQEEWKSLIIAAWMIVFLVGAYMIFKATQKREPFYVYAGVGVAMLAAATSVELSGASLTIAYTIESLLVAAVTYAVVKKIDVAEHVSVLLLGPIALSMTSIFSPAWNTGVLHKDFFVLAVIAVGAILLGWFFNNEHQKLGTKSATNFDSALLIVGSAYAYLLFWLSIHAAMPGDDAATMIALVVYTIIGIAAYFIGMSQSQKGLQVYGGVLLAFVVGRLLLVDVWHMQLTGRIITFFFIGALLMGTAFIGKFGKKNVIKA